MMAIKFIPLLHVVVVLSSPLPLALSFPNRYGRLQRAAGPLNRPQHYPAQVYDVPQSYPDEYFYEALSYPVYYPRTSKYEVYQAVLPYYYEHPTYYDGYEDSPDRIAQFEDEMYRETERQQREDAQPIGQETYFEEDANPDADDVNTAFLNNLIMSQMYQDAYGKVDDFPNQVRHSDEDEEVMELKNLADSKPPQSEERLRWFQKAAAGRKHNAYDSKGQKRSPDGHLEWFTQQVPSTTTAAPVTQQHPQSIHQRGQKEEVLPRPAIPVRHPFTASVINNALKKDRARQPSVYDTIKHMLDMEKSLETQQQHHDAAAPATPANDVIRPPMRKRIVASEDSLAHQLSGLKKHE